MLICTGVSKCTHDRALTGSLPAAAVADYTRGGYDCPTPDELGKAQQRPTTGSTPCIGLRCVRSPGREEH